MSSQDKKKKRIPRWIWIVVALVVLIVVMSRLSKGDESLTVTEDTATVRVITASVSESGVVEPVTEVRIAADVSGEITDLPVREGNYVHKGDHLVTIRPETYRSALEQAQAAVNSAIAARLQAAANVEQARASYLQDSVNYMRNKQLHENRVISDAEFENIRLKYLVSKAQFQGAKQSLQAAGFQVESSRASLSQARQNLDRTSIMATMDGTVTRLNSKLGERVVGTLQMSGTEILRIADLSRMEVTVDINENDIVQVRQGDSAHILVDAYGDRVFRGRVTDIAYSSSNDVTASLSGDQVTSFEVRILIDPASYVKDSSLMRGLKAHQSPFRPGMSAQVEIFTDREEKAVSVPLQSVVLRRDDENERMVVYVLKEDNTVQAVEVETGVNDQQYIQIRSGLKGGERIVSGPYKRLTSELKDGMKVRPEKENENE